jgi:hypothetical protein
MAKMPQDHGSRGLSYCIAILSTLLYRGSGSVGRPRAVNKDVSAMCSLFYRLLWWAGEGFRGSSIVQ